VILIAPFPFLLLSVGPQCGGLGFAVRAVICVVMIVKIINKRKSLEVNVELKSHFP